MASKATKVVGQMVRFPRMMITASRTRGQNLPANQKAFVVHPSVTKHEIKEYLTKIYGLDVLEVATANYEGKHKRSGPNYSKFYREKAYKKAIVTLGKDSIPPPPTAE